MIKKLILCFEMKPMFVFVVYIFITVSILIRILKLKKNSLRNESYEFSIEYGNYLNFNKKKK